MRAHMTHVEHKSDFSDQILADQEAMSRMQDEGGGSETSVANDATIVPAEKQPQRLHGDSSAVIALFRDPASAEAALRQLRSMGIVNENIGVAFSDSVISSPANNAATYRATGKAKDGSEFEDPALPDSFRAPFHIPVPATPNSAGYDADFEANQYRHPLHHVMVSVHVEGNQRQPVRDLLIHCGAAR
jgi:hypothetical protein